MKRMIIKIDEEKCSGCGLCIPNCPEGALQIIDGKARLVSDLLCDGLGACIGHCPEGAITVEEREAEAYDERKVMAIIAAQGRNTILAHLRHLYEHGQMNYLGEAIAYLQGQGIPIPDYLGVSAQKKHAGCPGHQTATFTPARALSTASADAMPSQLTHWPIQMHLINPLAPHFHGSHLLLAADCVAFSLGEFHGAYLQGKTLAIACPKLDQGLETYVEKLTALIQEAGISSLTVMMMQVPCCSGLLRLAQIALNQSQREIPLRQIVVGLKGEILKDENL